MSAIGTKQTSQSRWRMSAFGGIADIRAGRSVTTHRTVTALRPFPLTGDNSFLGCLKTVGMGCAI
jgi:hypothetical protein